MPVFPHNQGTKAERRRSFRLSVVLRSEYQLQTTGEVNTAFVNNLSDGGACLSLPQQVDRIGEEIDLVITALRGTVLVHARCEIIWQECLPEWKQPRLFATGIRFTGISPVYQNRLREYLTKSAPHLDNEDEKQEINGRASEQPVVAGDPAPSQIKRFFYNALESQWNPERDVEWNMPLGIDDSHCEAMAYILSPIVMGEFSAFSGIPGRILSFSNYEVKQYLAAQLVDETRHAEAFDLYLSRIRAKETYKRSWRNIHVLRYFNEMKRLKDNDKWLAGLLVTEITAHVLLSAYIRQTPCLLTQRLFKRILLDEARHIGFVNYYLRVILKNISESDRKFLTSVTDRVLRLTEQMLNYYEFALKAFDLSPVTLFSGIRKEILARAPRSILNLA